METRKVFVKNIKWTDKKLKKSEVLKIKNINSFYENHVVDTKYCFQIKKCNNKDCKFHKPIRMDKSYFNQVKWLPMPTISIKNTIEEKYDIFSEAYKSNDIPSDKYIPDGDSKDNVDRDPAPSYKTQKQFSFVYSRARKIIWCHECGRPRLLYSSQMLSDEQNNLFDIDVEKFLYTCGGPFLPKNHPLSKILFVSKYITCKREISSQ